MKRKLIAGILLFLCLAAMGAAHGELRGFSKGQGFEYVLLGSYPYEADGTETPVLWRVLVVENN